MEENICFICRDGAENNNSLFLLPCNQCNNDNIENKKYIHNKCLTHAINYDFNLSTETNMYKCPYCFASSIKIYLLINFYKTLKIFLKYLPHLLWGTLYIVAIVLPIVMDIPPNLTIDYFSFIILRLTIALVCVTNLRIAITEIPRLYIIAFRYIKCSYDIGVSPNLIKKE